jgi:spermidine synthase
VNHPEAITGQVRWSRVEDERAAASTAQEVTPIMWPDLLTEQQYRVLAQQQYVAKNMTEAVAAWRAQGAEPSGPTELVVLAEALAETGDEEALRYVEKLRPLQPTDADALMARLRWRQERLDEAADALESAFRRYRDDPWPRKGVMARALDQALSMGTDHRDYAPRLYQALNKPFAVYLLEEKRLGVMTTLATLMDFNSVCVEALAPLEPHVPWNRDFLRARLNCYAATHHPLKIQAEYDLAAFEKQQPMPLDSGL